MENIIREYKNYLISEEKSRATVEKYLADVKDFLSFANYVLTKEKAIEYKRKLSELYAPRSVNSKIASINSFLSFAGKSDCKVKSVRLQKEVYLPEEKELTKAEYIRLLRAAREKKKIRLCLIIETICATGIRVSELPFITVESARAGEATVSCKGKTRKVFIVKNLRKKLLKFAKSKGVGSGAIFVTRSGENVSRTNIWREMKKLCAAAKVNSKKVFPHNLRHLFARTFYNIEKDIAKLADILGHSSINTTRIYIIETGVSHRRKMENMRLVI